MRPAERLIVALAALGTCASVALAQPGIPQETPPGPIEGSKATETPAGPPPPAAPLKIEAAPEAPKAAPKAPVPTSRARFPIAVVQVVDKITTETNRFEVRLYRPVQYKSLIFTLHACEATAPGELDQDFIAHMEVDSQPPTPAGRAKPARKSVFKGWMYASSPSVSPIEHPVYDAWLVSCRTDAPPPVAAAPKPASPPKTAP